MIGKQMGKLNYTGISHFQFDYFGFAKKIELN